MKQDSLAGRFVGALTSLAANFRARVASLWAADKLALIALVVLTLFVGSVFGADSASVDIANKAGSTWKCQKPDGTAVGPAREQEYLATEDCANAGLKEPGTYELVATLRRTVVVKAAPATPTTTVLPTATITATAATVQPAAQVTLTWNCTDATSAQAVGAWSGTKALSGTHNIGAVTGTYGIACINGTKIAQANANVEVKQ